MIITEDLGSGQYRIRSYTPGEITINSAKYTHSLIIAPDTLIPDWRPKVLDDLTETDFDQIIELSPAILLLGTGQHFIMPHPSLLKYVQQQRIGIECMDTRAACRTFMALSAEGRDVVAALLL